MVRVLLLAAVASAALSCSSQELKLCGEIPVDGCPLGRGGTCEDPFCAALYDCIDGAWTLAETCEAFGGQGSGGGQGGTGGGQGGGCDLTFDHSNEANGCTPDLQSPDCPAVAAEGLCAPCLTGCIDFFLCTEAGWESVAYCDEDGAFFVTEGALR